MIKKLWMRYAPNYCMNVYSEVKATESDKPVIVMSVEKARECFEAWRAGHCYYDYMTDKAQVDWKIKDFDQWLASELKGENDGK